MKLSWPSWTAIGGVGAIAAAVPLMFLHNEILWSRLLGWGVFALVVAAVGGFVRIVAKPSPYAAEPPQTGDGADDSWIEVRSPMASGWRVVVLWLLAAGSVFAVVCFAVAIASFDDFSSTAWLGAAVLFGFIFGTLGTLVGAASRSQARAPAITNIAIGSIAIVVGFVAFAIGMFHWPELEGTHVDDGTCTGPGIRVQLLPGQDLDSMEVAFKVTATGGEIWHETIVPGSNSKIIADGNEVLLSGEWKAAEGRTKVVHLEAREPLPAGPWDAFVFTYGQGSEHTKLRCDIEGDGVPRSV